MNASTQPGSPSTQRIAPADIAHAASILAAGGLVAVPSETVYGLAADAGRSDALQRIFQAKGRPSDNPLIVHIAGVDQLNACCREVPPLGWKLFEAFAPGPLTIVLPKGPSIAGEVTAGLDTVAVRIPAHPTFHAILEATGLPLAAPSANRSGRPSATTWQAVIEDLDGRIDAVVCDAPCPLGLESTVVDVTRSPPLILRTGMITLEQLQRIEPTVRAWQGRDVDAGSMASPGLRHRHYQPKAPVIWLDHLTAPQRAAERIGFIGQTTSSLPQAALVCACASLEDYARRLYDFFRRCDDSQISLIVCERVAASGLGAALADRIRRASGDT